MSGESPEPAGRPAMPSRDGAAARAPGARGLSVVHVMECTIGGARRHLVDCARSLRAAGVEVAVVAAAERQRDFRGDLEALAREGVAVHELAMVRQVSPRRDRAQLRELERLLARLRPDVVHTHSSKAGVLGRLASLSSGIGVRVHTPHTFAFLFRSMFSPLARGLYREVERALAGSTERFVAVSAGEAATLRASGIVDPARIRVVANGIDPAPWLAARPIARAELGVEPGPPLCAVVGLLNAAKGQDLALEALARPGNEELRLLLVGHGEERERLEALARRLGLERRVRFLGWRTDVPAIVAACDFLVLPSRWEGMPYAVLEALAAGRPVVASDVDGARELVGDSRCGRIVGQESVEELAEAMAEMAALSRGAREALGAEGRRRVLAGYTLERMREGLLRLYAEVA
ncbi:MAG TPA: glycosyltransferase [Planctomycetota bacterium]|nr:glycosyltransferase [Planctomycetota bacterium]